MSTIDQRLDDVERQIRVLQEELASVRALARVQRPSARPAPAPTRPVAPPPAAPPEPPEPAEPRPSEQPVAVRLFPRLHLPRVAPADLLGPRGLAWAGGIVTLLGVVFFFALAVDRGWIGEAERVALGGLASALVLAAGVVGRLRYGHLYSALAAVGAGIAGGYATLLAAAALYELVVDWQALLLAAGVAAVGTAVSLVWSSQILAGIGLVGATLVPLSVVFDGGVSVLGTAFAALVFAATAAVAVDRGWRALLLAGFGASAVQIVWLVLQEGEGAPARVVALACVYVVLYVAAGLAREARSAGGALDRTATTLVLASAALGGGALPALLNGEALGAAREGIGLLALGAAYGALAVPAYRSGRFRDLGSLLAAAGLVVGGGGFAALLGGASLAVAWAVHAVALGWLGRRVADPRFQLASLAYLALAILHALAFEAPFAHLYRAAEDPASGLATVAVVAAAAAATGLLAGAWAATALGRAEGPLVRALVRFADLRGRWSAAALAVGSVLALYALALGTLALVEAAGARPAFAWGHVAVIGAWAALAAAALVAGIRLRSPVLEAAGSAWLGVTLLHFALFALGELPVVQRGWAAAALAAVLLAAGYFGERLRAYAATGAALAAIGIGAAVAAFAAVELTPSAELGYALLAAAGVYAALAADLLPRRRDGSTLLWAAGLGFALAAAALLLDGTALVAAWGSLGALIALLDRVSGEARLRFGAAAAAVLAVGVALGHVAPPSELFVAGGSPEDGVPAAALAALVVLALAWIPVGAGWETVRDRLTWAAGALGLFAVSLGVLGLAALAGSADATTEFQRGHTAVSAVWGVVALVALYLGLTRRWQSLRVAGFGLFGVALAKLFLYDLATLSSVTRALSFLAVGAVLLLAGFFYQRLTASDGTA